MHPCAQTHTQLLKQDRQPSKKNGQKTQTFLKRRIFNKHIKRLLVLWVTKENCILVILRYYLNTYRLEKSHTSNNTKYWRGCANVGTLSTCCQNSKLAQSLRKATVELSREVENALPWDPALGLFTNVPVLLSFQAHSRIALPMFLRLGRAMWPALANAMWTEGTGVTLRWKL